jgi:hypothetical protein
VRWGPTPSASRFGPRYIPRARALLARAWAPSARAEGSQIKKPSEASPRKAGSSCWKPSRAALLPNWVDPARNETRSGRRIHAPSSLRS